VRSVSVRSIVGGQIVLHHEHGFTSLFTRSSLRANAGSACTLEAAASEDVTVLFARHPDF
jgi:hypothetical protein